MQDSDKLEWKFNDNKIVKYTFSEHKTRIYQNYKERVNFYLENYSLLLKNLQQPDSGLYQATVSKDEDITVSQYNVIVQDPVSPVHLAVVPVWSSPGSCNLTVTCSSHNSSVTNTFTCDNNHHCSQQGGGESSEVTTSTGHLSVYLSDEGSVVSCNHSNQVSRSNDTKHITPLMCQLDSEEDVVDSQMSKRSHFIMRCVFVGVVICGCGAALITSAFITKGM